VFAGFCCRTTEVADVGTTGCVGVNEPPLDDDVTGRLTAAGGTAAEGVAAEGNVAEGNVAEGNGRATAVGVAAG
jgi:hypothetical protein